MKTLLLIGLLVLVGCGKKTEYVAVEATPQQTVADLNNIYQDDPEMIDVIISIENNTEVLQQVQLELSKPEINLEVIEKICRDGKDKELHGDKEDDKDDKKDDKDKDDEDKKDDKDCKKHKKKDDCDKKGKKY